MDLQDNILHPSLNSTISSYHIEFSPFISI